MPSSMYKALVATLAATAVQALPQPQMSTSSAPSMPTTTPASNSTSSSASAAEASAIAAANKALSIELFNEPTSVDRFKKLLTSDGTTLLSPDEIQKRVVFDFNQAAPSNGSEGGRGPLTANRATFPIVTDLGQSVAVAFLGPCGLNTPHVHPRATEFLTVVKGELNTGFVLENGFASEIAAHVGTFEGTVFPMGSIHFQQNPTCDDVAFVAALNSDDPGASQIAQNFFALNKDIVNATLGFPDSIDGRDIDMFKDRIPANLALGVEQCLETCGLSKSM